MKNSGRDRADCIAETKKYIYIFEFRMDQSEDEALKQIEKWKITVQ